MSGALGATIAALLAVAARTGIGLILISAAVPKLRDLNNFAAIVSNYRVLPAILATPVAVAIPFVELALGSLLTVGAIPSLAGPGAVALLLSFSTAIAINVGRGRTNIDCGCGGAAGGHGISAALAWRGVVLATIAALASHDAAGVSGLALLNAVVAGLILFILGLMVDTLLATASRHPQAGSPAAWTSS